MARNERGGSPDHRPNPAPGPRGSGQAAATPGRRSDKRAPRAGSIASPSDDINREIIKILQEDGRTPFAAIAEQLGVSEGTVRNRVNWMKDSGLLRIVAVADPTAIDYIADAMLGIEVAPGATPQSVAERLAQHPEVVYILWVSGRFDLLAEVVFESREDFLNFMSAECYGQSDIASVETMTGLKMYKNQFLLKRHIL
jgi:Lrp/AsnC family transcriptional regulator for asnA, asnC and gidA